MAAITATANFDGSTDTVAVSYSGITASSPDVIAGDPEITTPGTIFVTAYIDGTPTANSCTVRASAAFVGKVNLLVIG